MGVGVGGHRKWWAGAGAAGTYTDDTWNWDDVVAPYGLAPGALSKTAPVCDLAFCSELHPLPCGRSRC